jgi:hypothetical protein
MGMNEAIETLAAAVERFSTSLAPADLTAMGDALRAYRALPAEVSGEERERALVRAALTEGARPYAYLDPTDETIDGVFAAVNETHPRKPQEAVSERSEVEALRAVAAAALDYAASPDQDRVDEFDALSNALRALGCPAHDPHGDSDGACDRCNALDALEGS